MNSYYNFINKLKAKYTNLNLANAALLYEQTYDSIILHNLYDIYHQRSKVKTTSLTTQEIREYFLEVNYCHLIYKSSFPNLDKLLNDFTVEFNSKKITLLESFSLISLIPFCGLNQLNLGSNLYNYLTEVKPYYYQLINLYL